MIGNLTSLGGREVEVNRDPYLNSCKGTIYRKDLLQCTDEELLEGFQEYDPHVLKTWRIKKKDHNGQLQSTPLVILTFDHHYPPDYTYFGWVRCPVRQYIDPPRRCFNCQKYGHTGKKCWARKICAFCGQEANHEPKCKNSPHCSNCREPHPAFNKNCRM